jgi:hypothetical protein
LSRLGDLQLAFIVGDYAQGKDSGTIELVLVGEVDEIYLKRLEEKAKSILHRAIKTKVINEHEFEAQRNEFNKALLVWGNL